MRLVAEYDDIKGSTNNIKKLVNLQSKHMHLLDKLQHDIRGYFTPGCSAFFAKNVVTRHDHLN